MFVAKAIHSKLLVFISTLVSITTIPSKTNRFTKLLFPISQQEATMEEQRKLLDALMGLDRNDTGKSKGSEPRFTEDDVCKNFLCGLCPNEVFQNTVQQKS